MRRLAVEVGVAVALFAVGLVGYGWYVERSERIALANRLEEVERKEGVNNDAVGQLFDLSKKSFSLIGKRFDDDETRLSKAIAAIGATLAAFKAALKPSLTRTTGQAPPQQREHANWWCAGDHECFRARGACFGDCVPREFAWCEGTKRACFGDMAECMTKTGAIDCNLAE